MFKYRFLQAFSTLIMDEACQATEVEIRAWAEMRRKWRAGEELREAMQRERWTTKKRTEKRKRKCG